MSNEEGPKMGEVRESIKEVEIGKKTITQSLQDSNSPIELINTFLLRNPGEVCDSMLPHFLELNLNSQVELFRTCKQLIDNEEFYKAVFYKYVISEASKEFHFIIEQFDDTNFIAKSLSSHFENMKDDVSDRHFARCLVVFMKFHFLNSQIIDLFFSAVNAHLKCPFLGFFYRGEIITSLITGNAISVSNPELEYFEDLIAEFDFKAKIENDLKIQNEVSKKEEKEYKTAIRNYEIRKKNHDRFCTVNKNYNDSFTKTADLCVQDGVFDPKLGICMENSDSRQLRSISEALANGGDKKALKQLPLLIESATNYLFNFKGKELFRSLIYNDEQPEEIIACLVALSKRDTKFIFRAIDHFNSSDSTLLNRLKIIEFISQCLDECDLQHEISVYFAAAAKKEFFNDNFLIFEMGRLAYKIVLKTGDFELINLLGRICFKTQEIEELPEDSVSDVGHRLKSFIL